MEIINHKVRLDDDILGMRIDKYLSKIDSDLLYSRAFVERLIDDEKITINGKINKKKSTEVLDGDILEIRIEESIVNQAINNPQAEDLPLNIVYEDECMMVIDKPVGMAVHPAPGNYTGTLVNALIHYASGELSNCVEPFRPGIVHRLDKDTSGLLLVAKTNKMHAQLANLIQNREIVKKYKAILVGKLPNENGVIELPIARSKQNRKKMTVSADGKLAITKYSLIKDYEYFSYVDIELITGRTHQIRVHFAHNNSPVLGDEVYNSLAITLSKVPQAMQKRLKAFLTNYLHRQALHAYQLEFIHPKTNAHLCFNSPLPIDMIQALDYLDKDFT
ncbi:MAG TPA: RluA family pseudouridine synthase [Candidatus Cloacimonadota bacterium]|jgi:23S rRNA pseudouridine1911/1915/1917 synthase|nr:RluA family pseudouridine synthase [Candidatus Cloacimonadales bacterium]HPY95705.1 RluA family pseudouridine synthase [Candidatus Cloacimonadota bacterium]HQB40377.1 RluA family pseudouridine synthase [Candidatus Cloacimonadota bacterium]